MAPSVSWAVFPNSTDDESGLSLPRGVLFSLTVNYNHYETEGFTPDDFVDAISVLYGVAEHPATPFSDAPGPYGDEERIIARWQDSDYRLDLIRSAYGPTYRLIGSMKKREAQAKVAILGGQRLESEEEPQRDAARAADERKKRNESSWKRRGL